MFRKKIYLKKTEAGYNVVIRYSLLGITLYRKEMAEVDTITTFEDNKPVIYIPGQNYNL